MSQASTIRVILADDHNLVRQGIRSLLDKAGDIEVVGEASDGQEALRLVARLEPDVLVADVAMPRMDGLQAVERVRGQRRFYVRASGCFPLRYRLLKQHEYLKAREEYSSSITSFRIDGLASADSWVASAMDVDELGAEVGYLARSLAELHRKVDLIVNLLSSPRLPEGEDVRPRELRISGSGLDFAA